MANLTTNLFSKNLFFNMFIEFLDQGQGSQDTEFFKSYDNYYYLTKDNEYIKVQT